MIIILGRKISKQMQMRFHDGQVFKQFIRWWLFNYVPVYIYFSVLLILILIVFLLHHSSLKNDCIVIVWHNILFKTVTVNHSIDHQFSVIRVHMMGLLFLLLP